VQAHQRGQLVESATRGNRIVQVQLPVAALEIGAPQARRGSAPGGSLARQRSWPPENISEASGWAPTDRLRATM
jgi:hypothetical protein